MKVNFLRHLSYSSLSLYEDCSRCWYLSKRYGLKLPIPVSWEFGGKVHEAIEKYHLNRVLPEDKILYDYVAAYSKFYKSKEYDHVEEFWTVPIRHPFNESANLDLPLVVKIDRVYRGWIHDVKTSSKKYTFEEIDGRRQTALYAYAYREKFGKKEKGIRYDVLVKRVKPYLDPKDTFATDDDITSALQWLWKGYQKIQEDLMKGEPMNHSVRCYRKESMP